MAMNADNARKYLSRLVDKTLRIQVDDGRLFVGLFKCTDNERNIILSQAYEYRYPAKSVVEMEAEQRQLALSGQEQPDEAGEEPPLRVDMTSRFMGLVVVPGKHILTIEVEGPAET